ncbi:MAG TPA: M50 family metallopeptidase [Anaerolineales bacterium]|nr:M50 family metallopeptidase [Anaerolineales bacterium]
MNADLPIEIVTFVLALAALIIIHEFGHFLVARLLNVEVEEFGLGFPPRMATLFHAWGTRFSLNWLPFGGFVRPKGENDPTVEGGLAASSPWVRLAVYIAGPMANLLVGVLLYALIFSKIGVPIPEQVKVIEVAPGSPAAQAGLLPGDLLVGVNELEINSTLDLQDAIRENLDQSIVIEYSRNGQVGRVTIIPRSNPPEGQGAIGIVMGNPTRTVSVLAAAPTGAAAVVRHGQQLLAFPVRMIRGQIAPEEGRLVGFKGMFDIYQEVRQTETTPTIPAGVNVLGFFATITISLGILNLLPIPALDGGRIMFTLPEVFLGRRVPPKYENVINLVSFALLLVLMLVINLQDFLNPVQLPK